MSAKVTVIDYGMGNLFSVSRAFERVGATVELVDTPSGISNAHYLVLPGVGAFADGMAGLHAKGLVAPLRDFATSERPFLGICLGMQMMFETSEEFGAHDGLGLIPGRVVAIPKTGRDGRAHKIPHIGWNELVRPRSLASWEGTLLQDAPPAASAYFVHSFTAAPADDQYRLADADYDGCLISAAVRRGNMVGFQFHPEKSGPTGLRILENFLRLPVR